MTKLGIYEYRTKLLGRPMNMMEVLRLYPNSVLAKSTRLAKECEAWDNKHYTDSDSRVCTHISKCGSSPVYTRLIQEYWEKNQLTGAKVSASI